MVESPKSTNCGAGILTGSAARFFLHRMYRYRLEQLESLSPSNSEKMGGATRLLFNCWLMEVLNLLDCMRSGEVDCCISPISWITLRPHGEEVAPMIPIRAREEVSLIPHEWPMFPGMVPMTPLLLTYRGVLLVHVLPDVVCAKILFTAGVINVYVTSIIVFDGGS